jgi:hypothetical protein
LLAFLSTPEYVIRTNNGDQSMNFTLTINGSLDQLGSIASLLAGSAAGSGGTVTATSASTAPVIAVSDAIEPPLPFPPFDASIAATAPTADAEPPKATRKRKEPVTVAPVVAPEAVIPVPVFPMPEFSAPPPVTEPVAAPVAETTQIMPFGQFMQSLSHKMMTATITPEYVLGMCAELSGAFGVPLTNITEIGTRPEMVDYAIKIMQRDGK